MTRLSNESILDLINDVENEPEVRLELEDKTIEIKKCIKSIQNNFIRIGWLLRDIRNAKDYKQVEFHELGRTCKNIYEYAKQEFDFSKTSTASLILIVDNFSKYRDMIDDDYKDYDYSQLTEMTSLSKEQLKLCNPKMAVREIRALKKVKKIVPTSEQNQETQKNSSIQRFYKLKNRQARLNFIENYQNWRCVYRVPELNFAIYECKISNGDSLIYFETTFANSFDGRIGRSRQLLIKYKDGRFPLCDFSYSSYIDYITGKDVEYNPEEIIKKVVHK